MHIRPLHQTPLPTIVESFLEAFADYAVKMPAELEYWQYRFKIARVDYSLSFGMFDEQKLVGFIMIGIDQRGDHKVAFNTGTGVIPAYRGRKIVDQLYDYALPHFKAKGIDQCVLEVITENAVAIRVYERIGFKVTKRLRCFKGTPVIQNAKVELQAVPFDTIARQHNPHHQYYAWDNCNSAIQQAPEAYQSFRVRNAKGKEIGFFVIQPKYGYVVQYEITIENTSENWRDLFAAIAQRTSILKLNNVDERRTDKLPHIFALGIENIINQFEMEKTL